ncbi:alpha/beta fold hydrolase [Pseudomonas oryziphila]|uniref:Alpha/beta hydrolase n=1 Tax=Pseudomonas oryziphila TaxID=2894079 RepID=A0ABN5TL53_9PSED|nr:alpha/beta hydrolase [Pseudomonas oryziphila]AZL74431.1 alpha/beta hydrolase [Pseudomonas oryziphila]
MQKDTPVVLINGLIGCLDHPALHDTLPTQVIAPDLLGYGTLQDTAPKLIDIAAQVEHLHRQLQARNVARAHLVGHSVGGVVALMFAHRHPQQVASVTSVEGNFTLNDAFWSAAVARMDREAVEELLAGYRADPGTWLARAGVGPDARRLALAQRWLAHQPAATLQAMAASVVAVTGAARYPQQLQAVFAATPVHLVAGEHSRAGWDVPHWAERAAASFTELAGVGHLMMLEDPQGFASAIARLLG